MSATPQKQSASSSTAYRSAGSAGDLPKPGPSIETTRKPRAASTSATSPIQAPLVTAPSACQKTSGRPSTAPHVRVASVVPAISITFVLLEIEILRV